MPRKPKTQQKKDMKEVSGRDLFQTPNYAVDLLVPFLKQNNFGYIWECAAGLGKIVNRLESLGFNCLATDLSYDYSVNFLTDWMDTSTDCIVTNTPFSLKEEFYLRCREYEKPFALLVPADYSGWIIKAVQDGAEKIIPTRRIDYITPNILQRIWEGETWKLVKEGWRFDKSIRMEMFIDSYPGAWRESLEENIRFRFHSIYDAPSKLLRKYSSSYYHSMWLTWDFNLGQTETFVELTNEMKDII